MRKNPVLGVRFPCYFKISCYFRNNREHPTGDPFAPDCVHSHVNSYFYNNIMFFGSSEIPPTFLSVGAALLHLPRRRDRKPRRSARSRCTPLSWPFSARQMASIVAEFEGVSGQRKTEKPLLRRPVTGQVSVQRDQLCRREFARVRAEQNGADDPGREIRQTHSHREIIAPHTEPRRHSLNAVVATRKEHLARCEGLGDQGDETAIWRL